MVAILIGRQPQRTEREQEFQLVKAHGGHVYRDRLGQKYAVFHREPPPLSYTAQLTEFSTLPENWIKVD